EVHGPLLLLASEPARDGAPRGEPVARAHLGAAGGPRLGEVLDLLDDDVLAGPGRADRVELSAREDAARLDAVVGAARDGPAARVRAAGLDESPQRGRVRAGDPAPHEVVARCRVRRGDAVVAHQDPWSSSSAVRRSASASAAAVTGTPSPGR